MQEVSWPKIPYSQSQCSVEMGGSEGGKGNISNRVMAMSGITRCSVKGPQQKNNTFVSYSEVQGETLNFEALLNGESQLYFLG